MLEASSQGAAVAANPRASAQEPISFSPNAWAPAAAGGPSSAKARVYRNVRCNVISILLVRFGDRADVQAPVERGGSLFCWWDAKRNEHGQYRRCGRAWHYPIPLLRTWPRRSTILS